MHLSNVIRIYAECLLPWHLHWHTGTYWCFGVIKTPVPVDNPVMYCLPCDALPLGITACAIAMHHSDALLVEHLSDALIGAGVRTYRSQRLYLIWCT
jgi:hypothetical protein